MRVKTRLYGLLAAAIAGLLVVGMVGVYNAQQQTHFGEQASSITNVVRAQMQSDMMHDAIRGDVLNAIRMVSAKYTPDDRKALEEEFADHSKTFDEEMEFVARQKIPEVDAQLADLRADLKAYELAAADVIAAAFVGRAQADALWPAFEDKFSTLEDSMEKLGDTIEKKASVIKAEAASQGQALLLLNWGVIAVTSALVLALGLRTVTVIYRQLGADPQDASRLARAVTDGNFGGFERLDRAHPESLMAALVNLASRVGEIVASVAQLAKEQQAGQLSARMDSHAYPGQFARMAEEVNALVAAQNADLLGISALVKTYAEGDFSRSLPPQPGEKAAIAAQLEAVRISLLRNAQAAQYNTRIKSSLDSVSYPVRVCDLDGTIIYINKVLEQRFREDREAFAKQVAGFDPERMVGSSIGAFTPTHGQPWRGCAH